MKKIKSAILQILVMTMLLCSFSSIDVTASTSTKTLNVGDTAYLYQTDDPPLSNSAIYAWSWTSSEPNNVIIETSAGSPNVRIRAARPTVGSYAIVQCRYYYQYFVGRYTYVGEGAQDYRIYVNEVNPTGISVSEDSITIFAGNTYTLGATLYPSNATSDITWSSNNYSVATVSSNGRITGVAPGTAKITAKAVKGNLTDYCIVTVIPTVPVSSISLNKTSATLNEGEILPLKSTIAPSNATNQNITWSSSDTSVATVSGGTVKAISAGTATITVKAVDGAKTAVCTVSVLSEPGPSDSSEIWDGIIGSKFESGSGTQADPYIIKTPKQMAFLAQSVNSGTTYNGKYIKLANDIYLNNITNWKNWHKTAPENKWTPIGKNTSYIFKGTFDGDGHKISGVYINSTSDYQGLFGCLDYGSTVKNVGIVNSYIKGGNRVGGVVGYNVGIVSNCYNKGTVSSTSNYIGGVVGYNNHKVTTCYNAGNVSGANSVGGIVGQTNEGEASVINCYNKGTVSGSKYIGGVVGYNYDVIKNCYNNGSISASSYVGGIVGNNYKSSTVLSNASVDNCYNTGSISSSNNYAGSVAGCNTGTTDFCYYLNACAKDGNNTVQYGIGSSAKGSTTADVTAQTIGLNNSQMKDQASFIGFDFDSEWTIISNRNNGYPYLQALIISVTPGDIDGDGEVTNIDSAKVARYLAGWSGYDATTVNLDAADVDGDGEVTNIDSAIIARHLAGWNGYEVLPKQ